MVSRLKIVFLALTLWMPCCCCCCCCCMVTRCDGDPVMLVLLELVDIPARGMAPGRCWTPWCGPNWSDLSNWGKSRSRCIWIPSPGPMWLMWLKLDGAEIIFERRSLFLYNFINRITLVHWTIFIFLKKRNLTLVLTFGCSRGQKIAFASSVGCFQLGFALPKSLRFPVHWRHRKLWMEIQEISYFLLITRVITIES